MDVRTRDVEYTHDGTTMVGALVAPAGTTAAPGVLLLHDAFGLGDDMLRIAHGLAELGLSVFAADVWGGRARPRSEEQVGALIGALVADRPRWAARVAAAHATAVDQPEIDGGSLVSLGYCFGGSGALEHLRTGGDVRGVVAIHAGLDLLDPHADWSAARPGTAALLCTGADDPMATAAQRTALQSALDGAAVDWEVDLYGGTVHAFTSAAAASSPRPDVVAYHPRNAARAWRATTRFLRETFPTLPSAVDQPTAVVPGHR